MSGGLCLLACSSDDDPAAVTGGPDAATTETSTSSDTGAKVDSGGSSGTDATTNTDATTTDATTEAGVDAGPTRTVETKSTGNIHLAAVYVLANFFEDDTVIRWSNAPECMIIVRSPTKPASTAGTITIGGQIVGADGGPASEITLDNPPDYFSDQFLLPPTSEFTVDVSEGPGSPAFPALAKQTIRPSLGTPVTVNAPLPDAGTATIPVAPNTAFTVTWAVPTGDISEQRFVVDLAFFASGADGSKRAEVLCDTGLSAGTFTVPAEVMTDALAQTLPISGTPSSATLTLYAGGQKVVTVKNAVYVITAAPDESTTLPVGTSVSLP